MKIASTAFVFMIGLTIAQLSIAQPQLQFAPPTPPDLGTPGDRGQGGGNRGPCDDQYANLAALVPSPIANRPADQWGLTISDRPTVWFNVPTGIAANTLVEWRLRDAQGKTLSRTVSRLPKTSPGVVAMTVPQKISIGRYQWDLALYCDSSGTASDTTFDQPVIRKGWIQRLTPTTALQQELAQTKTPIGQATLFAKSGIWYDALTALGAQMQRPQKSKDIVEAWSELLKQQKLEGKTSATVTPCCKL